jgi:hypothetical protein
MERDALRNNQRLLSYLAHLPKKIVSLEGIEHTPAFVLHELCNENCFNLSKAAFFADSPDFNSLKGIAGFDGQEQFGKPEVMWQEPQSFIAHLNSKAHFNTQVRQVNKFSLFKNGTMSNEQAQELAKQLGFQNPAFASWQMKHDNFGFLVYEHQNQLLDGIQEQLDNSLYLLNFCPLF